MLIDINDEIRVSSCDIGLCGAELRICIRLEALVLCLPHTIWITGPGMFDSMSIDHKFPWIEDVVSRCTAVGLAGNCKDFVRGQACQHVAS